MIFTDKAGKQANGQGAGEDFQQLLGFLLKSNDPNLTETQSISIFSPRNSLQLPPGPVDKFNSFDYFSLSSSRSFVSALPMSISHNNPAPLQYNISTGTSMLLKIVFIALLGIVVQFGFNTL